MLKKIICSSFLFLLFVNTSFASEYYCKEAYTEKIERIEKNRTMRNIGRGVVGVSIIGGGIIASFGVAGGGGAVLSVLMTAPIAGGITNLFDREKGLLQAQKFVEYGMRDRESLREQKYNEYIDSELNRYNSENEVRVTRAQVIETYDYEKFELYTLVDIALKDINKSRKRNGLEVLTYKQFQEELRVVLDTDTFCRKRAETFKKIKRLLNRNLKNKVI